MLVFCAQKVSNPIAAHNLNRERESRSTCRRISFLPLLHLRFVCPPLLMISGCNANPNDEQTLAFPLILRKKKSEQTEPGLVWTLRRLEKYLLLTGFKKKFVLSCIKASPLAHLLVSNQGSGSCLGPWEGNKRLVSRNQRKEE